MTLELLTKIPTRLSLVPVSWFFTRYRTKNKFKFKISGLTIKIEKTKNKKKNVGFSPINLKKITLLQFK